MSLARRKSEGLHESESESTDYIVCTHLTWQEGRQCRILGASADEEIQFSQMDSQLSLSKNGDICEAKTDFVFSCPEQLNR